MGLFDKLRRKPPSRASSGASSADPLLAALEAAITTGDRPRFEALCREHSQAIVDGFAAWRTPGEELGPEALDARVQLLAQTAQYLAEALDRPEPWDALTGPANPFERWSAAQQGIMQRVEVLDYLGAVAQAEALVTELDGFSGPARDQQEELVRGLLGQLLRQVARPEQAIVELEWTLARCRAQADDDGVGIYLEALYQADRDCGRASAWASPLADHLDAHDQAERAAWLRAVHARFPGGEPLLRMVVVVDGRRYELDEADEPLRSGHAADVVFERNRQTLAPASKWLERGREHGGQGELDDAIACFVAAAEADPHDPESRNLHAFTLMLMNRPELALPLYDTVERLAPGWFHARTWRSLAQRQLDAQLDHHVVRVIHTLQDGGLSPDQRLELAGQTLSRWPRVPELHLHRGCALAELGEDPQHAWLAGLEVCEAVPSTRTRLLQALGRVAEVVEVEGGNLMAIAAARLQLRVSRPRAG